MRALRRFLAVLVTAAAALALVPTTHAATPYQPSPDAATLTISAYASSDGALAWDQTSDAEHRVLAWHYHGGQHQKWSFEEGTLRNVGTGWCATAIDLESHGRSCDGSSAQQWEVVPFGPDEVVTTIRNKGTGGCATFRGEARQISLGLCDRSIVTYWYWLRA